MVSECVLQGASGEGEEGGEEGGMQEDKGKRRDRREGRGRRSVVNIVLSPEATLVSVDTRRYTVTPL